MSSYPSHSEQDAILPNATLRSDGRPTCLSRVSRLRVIIQYNCIPHYRRSIFERLSLNSDVNFTLVTDSKPDTPFLEVVDLASSAIRYRIAETYRIKIPLLTELFWQPRALSIIWQSKPDVVIALANPFSLTAWGIGLLCALRGIPLLLWGHGLLGDERGPKWWLRRLFYRLGAGQLLYGQYAKQLLVAKGFDPDELYVIYNSLDYEAQRRMAEGISHDEASAARSRLGVHFGEGLVVFTGRLQAVKRLDLLIRAIGILARRGKRIHVALMGEGAEQRNLAGLASNEGVADLIHFLGATYDERQIGLIYRASDLSVIPSGAGLSIMHAMVFGTPVLLHNHIPNHFPEWEAVEEGVTGFFYQHGDIEDLARKIESAIYPIAAKTWMAAACEKVIRERYNPSHQEAVFVRAVQETVQRHQGR